MPFAHTPLKRWHRSPVAAEFEGSLHANRRSSRRGRQVTSIRVPELLEIMEKGQGRMELMIAGQQDYLYHNDGGGRFRIVNAEAGIRGNEIGLAATWWISMTTAGPIFT